MQITTVLFSCLALLTGLISCGFVAECPTKQPSVKKLFESRTSAFMNKKDVIMKCRDKNTSKQLFLSCFARNKADIDASLVKGIEGLPDETILNKSKFVKAVNGLFNELCSEVKLACKNEPDYVPESRSGSAPGSRSGKAPGSKSWNNEGSKDSKKISETSVSDTKVSDISVSKTSVSNQSISNTSTSSQSDYSSVLITASIILMIIGIAVVAKLFFFKRSDDEEDIEKAATEEQSETINA